MKWLGLAFATLIALAAMLAEDFMPLAPVALALIVTILLANTAGTPAAFRPGLDVAAKRGLFVAIILLGFRVQWVDLRAVGEHWYFLLPAVGIPLLLGALLAQKGGKTPLLIGIGTAICGVSAMAAARPVAGGDDEEFASAVGTVTILGTIGLLTYPLIGWALQLSPEMYGIWSGLTLHAVPQAVGAGFAMGTVAGGLATTFKLARVAALPLLLFAASPKKARVPKEIVGFLAAVVLANSGLLSGGFVFFLAGLAKFPLVIAIVAIGLQTHFGSMKMGRNLATGAGIWLVASTSVLVLLWMQS